MANSIKTQLLLFPDKPKIKIYHQVLERFSEINLNQRTFYYYLDTINFGNLVFEKKPTGLAESRNSHDLEAINRTDKKTDDIKVRVGSKIGAYRTIAGLKKVELARKIKVAPSMITYYEQGKKQPSLNTIIKIAKATSVPVEYFLTDRAYPIDEASCGNENSVNKYSREIKTEYYAENKKNRVSTDVVNKVKQLVNEANKLMNSNPERCIEISNRALKISEDKNYSLGVGLSYLQIGEGFISQSNYSEAFDKLLLAEKYINKRMIVEGCEASIIIWAQSFFIGMIWKKL